MRRLLRFQLYLLLAFLAACVFSPHTLVHDGQRLGKIYACWADKSYEYGAGNSNAIRRIAIIQLEAGKYFRYEGFQSQASPSELLIDTMLEGTYEVQGKTIQVEYRLTNFNGNITLNITNHTTLTRVSSGIINEGQVFRRTTDEIVVNAVIAVLRERYYEQFIPSTPHT